MKFSVTLVFSLLFAVVLAAYWYLMAPARPALKGEVPVQGEKLLNLGEKEIAEIEISRSDGGRLVLEKNRTGWVLVHPETYPVEEMIVKGILSALHLSPVVKKTKPSGGWAEYGLEEPDLSVSVTASDGSSERLFFGGNSPMGEWVYVRREGESEILLTDRNLKQIFDISPYSLMDKKIFTIPLKDVDSLKFQTDRETYELARSSNAWLWVEPILLLGQEITPEEAGRVLAEIQNFYVKEFTETSIEENGGILDASVQARVHIAAGGDADEAEQTLLIGREIPEKNSYEARLRGEGRIFLIDRERVHSLFERLRTMALESRQADEEIFQMPLPENSPEPEA